MLFLRNYKMFYGKFSIYNVSSPHTALSLSFHNFKGQFFVISEYSLLQTSTNLPAASVTSYIKGICVGAS